ncbi:MAG: hypothetical protein KDC85_18355, partial [Saprospiraceae bacterium]|nr:hypothetical protein [Saprospiraceae bacterium]
NGIPYVPISGILSLPFHKIILFTGRAYIHDHRLRRWFFGGIKKEVFSNENQFQKVTILFYFVVFSIFNFQK